jgi:hypothetical protein
MVRWASGWTDFLMQAGNEPGANTGDVVVELVKPVAGLDSIRCPSGDLTVQAEGGVIIGLTVVLEDGRRVLVPWAGVSAIVDAPADGT